jgi:hypothetical protein
MDEPVDENIITVYLTSGRYPYDVLESASSQMQEIPNQGTSFLVHLGDWNDPENSSCGEDSYQGISQLFQSSTVPVYFVTGENGTCKMHAFLQIRRSEFFCINKLTWFLFAICVLFSDVNNCLDQTKAVKLWQQYLVGFETKHWESPPWEIFRQGNLSKDYRDYLQNFLFVHGQAAFVAIDLAGGETEDRMAATRLQANLVWVETAYKFVKDKVDTIFIFAHDAPPGSNKNNQDFYKELFDVIKQQYSDMNFVLVHHSDSGQGFSEKYNGVDNLDVASVLGSTWPPLRMTLDFSGPERSITIETSNKWWDKDSKSKENAANRR